MSEVDNEQHVTVFDIQGTTPDNSAVRRLLMIGQTQ
jgi:hypothetical protein